MTADLLDKLTTGMGLLSFPDFDVLSGPSYPPYNLIKLSETQYQFQFALAGFEKENLSVKFENNTVYVEGFAETDTAITYVHKGIAGRTFKRVFRLHEDLKVTSSAFSGGILTVDVERIVKKNNSTSILIS
jgi:molecular chaperone IbpA